MIEAELLAREGIRHTLAAYSVAGDRLQTEAFVAVFTDDAILETDGIAASDAFRCNGRDEIQHWIKRWREPQQDGQAIHQASFVRHHLSTCLIEFAAINTANVRTYWTAYTDIGADHGGYYVDNFRRVGERWLIAHRRIRLDWRSPNSLMFSAIARTT